jgi:hypothetical protein
MKDYQQRVVTELNELHEKIGKLDAFLMAEDRPRLNEAARELLIRQLDIMQDYRDVLQERIDLF